MKYLSLLLFLFAFNMASGMTPAHLNETKIEEKISVVEASKNLDAQDKASLLNLYKRILDNLNAIQTNENKTKSFVEALEDNPEKIARLKAELEKIEQQRSKDIQQLKKDEEHFKQLTLEEVEQELNKEVAKQAKFELENAELKESIQSVSGNTPNIRKRLSENHKKLSTLVDEYDELEHQKITDEKEIAYLWLLESQLLSIRTENKMLEQQLSSHPVRLELLRLRKEIFDYQSNQLIMKISLLEQLVNTKQGKEIKKTQELLDEEQRKLKDKHPVIQLLAELNSKVSQDTIEKNNMISSFLTQEKEAQKQNEKLVEEYNGVRKKLEIAGLNKILGQVLLEKKKTLPDQKQYKKNLAQREGLIRDSSLTHIQYQEELNKIKNTQEYISGLVKDVPDNMKAVLENDLETLVNIRQKLLQKAVFVHEDYLQAVGDLDYAEKELLTSSTSYAQLINEHLFWLKSAPTLTFLSLKNVPDQFQFLLSPSHWIAFVNDYIQKSLSSYKFILGLLFIVFLMSKKKSFVDGIVNNGIKTRKISTDSLRHTWQALFYTLLLAIPLPLFLWLSGEVIVQENELSVFSVAIGQAMQVIDLPLFSLLLFMYLCLPGGVAEVHFKWSQKLIHGLIKELKRLMFTLLPAMFVTAILISKEDATINDGLGRVFLMVTLLTFSFFFYRLLKPATGILSSLAQKSPDGLFSKYQKLWFYTSLLATFSLIALAIMGYVYTVEQLTASLVFSVWFIFGLILIQQLSVRWLLLTQRRFALRVALERRKTLQDKKSDSEPVTTASVDNDLRDKLVEHDEHEINMQDLSDNSRQLLNLFLFILGISGMLYIWSDVLPALGFMEKIELWHYKGVSEGVEKLLPITLQDVALSILIILFTLIGAKRFPAIIEIILIQYSQISSGSRYTITTLLNYIILGVGFILIFNILGADWSKFQWLFAALGVGIGFGLQEIVANFISGIIILFERPIRVGDFVSVGENEGIVTRIQIRATTILTYDRKELLVPNKEFITGQLINLSLSDPTSRIIIPVGIAYGSNVNKAKELLLETAYETEHVLSDPEPKVFFHTFGDNSLNMQLRCFVDNVDLRMRTTSNINELINEKFNNAGIEISFPQRDVHLDMSAPIEVNLLKKS